MQAGPQSYALSADAPGVAPWLGVPCDWRRPESRPRRVYRRAADGYAQVLPRPAADEIAGFYDLPYYTHPDEADAPDPGGLGWRVLRRLVWQADDGVEADADWFAQLLGPEPRRVFEIGCGDGARLARLRDLGHDVAGSEPDPVAHARAVARHLDIVPDTAEQMQAAVPPESVDCVLMMHVLEHCLDPEAALSQALALLRSGGTVVIEVPNNECAGIDSFGEAWLFLDIPRHLNFFTGESLRGIVAAAGFVEIELAHDGYCSQFAPLWIAQQSCICEAFGLSAARNTLRAHVRHYLRTRGAPPARKYCAIRITARKPAR